MSHMTAGTESADKPIKTCPNCGAMYSGGNHKCKPGRPKVRSYTQLSQWSECGKRYELERVQRVRSRPGVWLPAGTAVHAAVEEYLRASLTPQA